MTYANKIIYIVNEYFSCEFTSETNITFYFDAFMIFASKTNFLWFYIDDDLATRIETL